MAPTQHWLIKSEPSEYAYAQLESDGRADWTGIRSFEARKPLRAMKKGDLALYYHTGGEKAVVGLATVTRAAFPDPTAPKGEEWDAVEVAPRQALKAPVTLAAMKVDRALKGLPLLTRGRLSVMPVTSEHFHHILTRSKHPARKK